MKIITEEKLYIGAFICNLLIFVLEIVGFIVAGINMGGGLFHYYTELSNILLLISSAFMLISVDASVRRGCGTNYPTHLIRFIATASTTLTAFIVVAVLIPMSKDPARMLFRGANLYHHTLCPLLSLLSFLFLEKEESNHLKISHTFYALSLTILYGVVFTVLNIFKVTVGPYPFLMVYDQPVWASILWFLGIIIFSYLIAYLLYLGNKKIFFRGIYRG